MFKKCVALILLLSMSVFPMTVLAQQSNTNSKAEADIAEVSDAQLAGESDARAKTQIERFFTLGVCAGSCLTFVGCLLSATIADVVYPEHVRYHSPLDSAKVVLCRQSCRIWVYRRACSCVWRGRMKNQESHDYMRGSVNEKSGV